MTARLSRDLPLLCRERGRGRTTAVLDAAEAHVLAHLPRDPRVVILTPHPVWLRDAVRRRFRDAWQRSHFYVLRFDESAAQRLRGLPRDTAVFVDDVDCTEDGVHTPWLLDLPFEIHLATASTTPPCGELERQARAAEWLRRARRQAAREAAERRRALEDRLVYAWILAYLAAAHVREHEGRR